MVSYNGRLFAQAWIAGHIFEHACKDLRVAAAVSQDREAQLAPGGSLEALNLAEIPILCRQGGGVGGQTRSGPGQEPQDDETESGGGKSV